MTKKSLLKRIGGIFLMAAMTLSIGGCALDEEGGTSSNGNTSSTAEGSGDTIKVGILHSLSGTMAISETSVRDAELLAIKEINEKGGVLGKQIEAVIEDGASDTAVFISDNSSIVGSNLAAKDATITLARLSFSDFAENFTSIMFII